MPDGTNGSDVGSGFFDVVRFSGWSRLDKSVSAVIYGQNNFEVTPLFTSMSLYG
jgi:hypothetical protein